MMASILRKWGIPCRYVSGYLAPGREGRDGGREPRVGRRDGSRGSGGSASTRPTTPRGTNGTSGWRSAGTTRTFRRPGGVFHGTARSRVETEVIIERW